MKRLIVVTLAGPVLTVAALTGCANVLHHAASPAATRATAAAAQDSTRPGSWKTLTADYAVAGTVIAGGDASGAVPQLEAGNSAISAFSGATGKC